MPNDLVLLVEGRDDKHVILALVAHHNFKPEFLIQDEQGIDSLIDGLPIRLRLRQFRKLGIVVDADSAPQSRWDRLVAILAAEGYSNVPAQPAPDGTVVDEPGLPRVGVWLMPDNVIPGMLEDFAVLLVPPGDSLWARAEHCVQSIPESERRCPSLAKVLIHTWLAWQDDPGTPMGGWRSPSDTLTRPAPTPPRFWPG
jgi:hypothetical protein